MGEDPNKSKQWRVTGPMWMLELVEYLPHPGLYTTQLFSMYFFFAYAWWRRGGELSYQLQTRPHRPVLRTVTSHHGAVWPLATLFIFTELSLEAAKEKWRLLQKMQRLWLELFTGIPRLHHFHLVAVFFSPLNTWNSTCCFVKTPSHGIYFTFASKPRTMGRI
jgi:hypothetical protein